MSLTPKRFFFRLGLTVAAVLILLTAFAVQPPSSFPKGYQVHIGKNDNLSSTADILFKKHIIRSPLLFKLAVVIFNGSKRAKRSVVAGDYYFSLPINVATVARRIVSGEQDLERIKVLIPEGTTVREIAWILLKSIPNFNAPYFIKIATPFEGRLFPDTYFFYSNTTADQVLSTMRKTFDDEFKKIILYAGSFGRKESDIVTMASIVEEEATSSIDRAIIAGILWKRMDIGMPLQVDPPLAYITMNTTGYISIADTLIDSPYNTYRHKGLPIAPISNPGVDALKATLYPTMTPYLFYLSDKKGIMRYATTYEGHIKNKMK